MPSAFELKAKTQQAGFRQSSPTVSALGRSSTDPAGKRHPHLLGLGAEADNLYPGLRNSAGAIAFFEEREIQWWQAERAGDAGKPHTPTRNMASSQIACVNFMLPLGAHPAALLAVMRSIDPEVREVLQIHHRGLSTYVEHEWVGCCTTLEPGGYMRGAQRTSVDAMVIAATPTGRRAFLIEWKYVEESGDDSQAEGSQGHTRRERYQERFKRSHAFRRGLKLADVLHDPVYQFARMALLGDRMVEHRELGIADYRLVLVCSSGNAAYRQLTKINQTRWKGATMVAEVLKERVFADGLFIVTSQAQLLQAASTTSDAAITAWAEYHRARYDWT